MDDVQADAMGGGAERGVWPVRNLPAIAFAIAGERPLGELIAMSARDYPCGEVPTLGERVWWSDVIAAAKVRDAQGLAGPPRVGQLYKAPTFAAGSVPVQSALASYGEQCPDTDGLAADRVSAKPAVEHLGDALGYVCAAHAARDVDASALGSDNPAWVRAVLLELRKRRLEEAPYLVPTTRQPLSAGWHHLACVTSPQPPKPLPARALNARYRGGLITEATPCP